MISLFNQKKPNGYWNNFNHCQDEAMKYRNIKEFSIHSGSAYNAARKNKWLDKLTFKA